MPDTLPLLSALRAATRHFQTLLNKAQNQDDEGDAMIGNQIDRGITKIKRNYGLNVLKILKDFSEQLGFSANLKELEKNLATLPKTNKLDVLKGFIYQYSRYERDKTTESYYPELLEILRKAVDKGNIPEFFENVRAVSRIYLQILSVLSEEKKYCPKLYQLVDSIHDTQSFLKAIETLKATIDTRLNAGLGFSYNFWASDQKLNKNLQYLLAALSGWKLELESAFVDSPIGLPSYHEVASMPPSYEAVSPAIQAVIPEPSAPTVNDEILPEPSAPAAVTENLIRMHSVSDDTLPEPSAPLAEVEAEVERAASPVRRSSVSEQGMFSETPAAVASSSQATSNVESAPENKAKALKEKYQNAARHVRQREAGENSDKHVETNRPQ